MIEGYNNYGDQTWPDDITSFEIFKIRVQYIENGRTLKKLPPELGGE